MKSKSKKMTQREAYGTLMAVMGACDHSIQRAGDRLQFMEEAMWMGMKSDVQQVLNQFVMKEK